MIQDGILEVEFTETGTNEFYVGLSDLNDYYIYKSEDGGNTFNFFNTGFHNPIGLDKICLSASLTGTDRVYNGACGLGVTYATGETTLYSNDCSHISMNFHTDMRASQMLIDPSGKEILVIGHDGGISIFDVTNNPGSGYNTVECANGEGLAINQMYSISISQFGTKKLITGNQDNNSFSYDFGLDTWTKFSGGDGHETWYSSDGSRFLNTSNATIITNGISGISSSIGVQGASLNMPVELDEKTNTLYYRGNYFVDDFGTVVPLKIYKRDNGVVTTLNVPTSVPLKKITELAFAESDKNVIYFSGGAHHLALTGGNSNDKFFKSVDGLVSYIDLSNSIVTNASGGNAMMLKDAMAWRIISAIKIDPADPEHLWVGLSGASPIALGNELDYRCLESFDGGLTWKDYTAGLPPFPVNDIEFVKGTNDQLIAATDVGVFIRNADDTEWHCYQGDMPIAVVTDIAIDYCDKKIFIATYGRGVYKTDLDFIISAQYPELVIDDLQNIEESYNCVSSIHVKNGGKLVVTGTLYMNEDAKIVVEPGGELVIDGGIITNQCGGLWQGIEVHGINNVTQNTGQQGELMIKNGAIIEHARCAVELWEPDNFLSTGGFVRSYNSTFRNNITDVKAMFYENISGTHHLPNRTYFSNTEFIWDDNFRTALPEGHVVLALVNGIIFRGCTFEDKRDPSTISFANGNVGIFSLDAGYRVTAVCATSGCVGEIDDVGSGWDPTIFENLYVGIWATNSFTTNTINVDRCLFQDNGYGIELVSVPSPVIIRSKFEFTDDVTHFAVNSAMHGIHAINSKNLRIEENRFIDNSPGTHGIGTFGVVSSDLGEQYERIYKNTFQGVTNACYAQGKNRSVSTNGLVGLEFPCNTNINNHWDHRVVPTLWGIDGPNYGVKKISGSFDIPVGTTFTNDIGNLVFDEDYRNSSHFPITYWYHTTQTPDDYQSSSVTMYTNPLTINNTCLSTIINYGGGVIKLLPGDKAAVQSEFYTISGEILLKQSEYEDNLLDVGEIAFIMTEIDNLAPNNKQSVRDMLISYSPYLTTEILFAVANNAPSDYNHPWLRDLLLANIEAVTPELLSFLQTKQFPLPAPMRQAVANAMGLTYTQKTILESEISQLYADRAFYSNILLIDVVHDTTFVDTDSLRRWLTLQNNILFQQQIIDSYLQDGNFDEAELEIDNFELFALTAPAHLRIEIADFVSLKRWLISVLQIRGQITQLSVADLVYLRNMANQGFGTARYQAQNILCFFYNECEFYFIDSEGGPKSQITPSHQVLEEPEPTFSVYPNPASDWVIIELSQKTFDQLENTEIIITDITGKVIHQTQLIRNTYLWETGPIQNGVYLILIRSNDKLFATQKVIVNH